MAYGSANLPSWLEFRLVSDGLETKAVQALPLTTWHAANNPVFGYFALLPPELRLKVWEYLIVPRIVGIACFTQEDPAASNYAQSQELWRSQSAIKPSTPVLLHVNRETRALALKHYELSFEWKIPRVLWDSDFASPRDMSPSSTPIATAVVTPVSSSSQHGHPGPATADGRQSSSLNNVQMSNLNGPLAQMNSYHELLDPRPSALGNSSSSTITPGFSLTSSDSVVGVPTVSRTTPRVRSPPRTWFNFGLDAIYLVGTLEPYDSFGFNSPMAYFISSQTTRRVRKTAVAFRALGYGEAGPQQIFGTLFHVVDRFTPPDNEILVCVTESDEWTNAMLGNHAPLVGNGDYSNIQGNVHVVEIPDYGGREEDEDDDEVNVVQKIWRDWYRGSIVTSPLAKINFVLIREDELEKHVMESSILR